MYKLLIADDEALEREALTYFVKNSSYEIHDIIECSNGNEVVKKVMLEKPDIMILDINMPGMNGLEVLQQLKNMDYPFRAIFSTAYNYFEYAVKALQLGAMDFMVKPVKKEKLLNVLLKAIDQLDSETEKRIKEQRFKNTFEFFGENIVKKLITGVLKEEVLYYLETMDISYNITGKCLCLKTLDDIPDETKKEIIQLLKKEIQYLDVKILTHWCNEMLTLIIFSHPQNYKKLCVTAKEQLLLLLKQKKYNFILGEGTTFEDLSQVEESFEKARELVGDLCVSTENEGNKESSFHEGTVKKICDYVEQNFNKHLTLDGIANEAGYSKFYINRIFKQKMNRTIMGYLTHKRIAEAKNLLLDDKYSIKQVSSMIGYSDPNYFTLTFKKIEGISPMKFRYQCKEDMEYE